MTCSPVVISLERLMLQILKTKLEGVPVIESGHLLFPLTGSCPKTELSLIKCNACDLPEEPILDSTLVIVLHVLPAASS